MSNGHEIERHPESCAGTVWRRAYARIACAGAVWRSAYAGTVWRSAALRAGPRRDDRVGPTPRRLGRDRCGLLTPRRSACSQGQYPRIGYSDYIAGCGESLVVAAGFDRYSTSDKTLVRLTPPAYRPATMGLSRTQSWTTPSCSANGEIAASAGASSIEAHFGLEHRSIWLISSTGARARRLTTPPGKDVTDEMPRIARDGRYILYIETRSPPRGSIAASGSLWAVPVGGAHPKPIGPIAKLGTTSNYYGHYGWAAGTAWHEG